MKSRTYRKVQHKKLEFGSYNFRVGDLWGNSSDVIVITDIYQYMSGINEWIEIRYSRLDDLSKEYISEQIVSYIERNNFAPMHS